MNSSLQIRVNGITPTKLTIRRQMRSGYPDGLWEIVITDPVIGNFAINDSFDIECKLIKKPWRRTSVGELLTTLTTVEV